MTTAREQATGDQVQDAAAQSEAQSKPRRLWEVDALRGVAILLMAVYHFSYDLDQFGDFSFGANAGAWRAFANTIASMFIILVGVSLVLSYTRSVAKVDDEWDLYMKYLLRGMRIFGYGMLITVTMWFFAPDGSIIFGILHLIGISIILAYPFLRWPKAALPVGLVIIVIGVLMGYPIVETPAFLWLGFRPEGVGNMYDYRPLIPWFGVTLIGIYAGSVLYRGGQRQFSLPDLSGSPPIRGLAKLGEYSLFFYLIHQPVILLVLELTGVINIGLF